MSATGNANRERGDLRSIVFVGLLVFTAWAGDAAHAQAAVNQGVNPALGQSGRMLDRNPQLGSGGYNYTRPVTPLMIGNANASGIAGGGFSLRSVSPIQDPTAFRASLGSETLSSYLRDSVSVANGPLGTVPLGQPFYDPAVTVPTVGFLQGLSTPAAAEPRGIGPLDLRIQSRLNLQSSLNSRIAGLGPTPPQSPVTRENTLATSSSIFGLQNLPAPPRLLLPTDSEKPWSIPQDEGPQRRAGETEAVAADGRWSRPGEAAPRSLDAMLRSDLYPRLGPLPSDGDTVRVAERRGPAVADADALTRAGSGAPLLPRAIDASLLPGFDAFTDLRLAVALRSDPQAAWFTDMQEAMRDRPDLARQVSAQAASDVGEFLRHMLNTPLRSLTGGGASVINDQLLKAESLMDIGHYAEAADRFEAARQAAPTNPLPLFGKGHALLAAGQYRSAATTLLQGIQLAEQTPGLASVLLKRLDLKALMGGGEIVDIRRADIMKQLTQRENPELRFLLGYLEYHSGDRVHGLENLKRAADDPRASSLIGRYPTLLAGEGGLLSLEQPGTPEPQAP